MKYLLIGVLTIGWAMAQDVMPVSDARALELGSTVTISGTVTVPSGAFASSIASGFAVQDGSAGIYVADDGVTSLPVGIGVSVTGTLEEANAQLFIQPESVTVLPAMATILPETLMTGEVSEASEGGLVYVSGAVTRIEDDAPWGYKVYPNC